jgi:hypothetical protein
LNVNIDSFKNLLLKGTLNYSSSNIGFTVDKERIRVGMRGDNYVVILKMNNDLIPDVKGEASFYFDEPSNQIRTHLDLLSDCENVEIGIKDNHIILNADGQKSVIHFCSPNLVPTFSGSGPKTDGVHVYDVKISHEWMYNLDKIQKIASKFKKIYFVVKNGKIYIEATDKTNSYSNGLTFELGSTDLSDTIMCFDFKPFSNAFKVLGDRYEEFTMSVNYIEKLNAGIISFINEDGSEKYFILSKDDID